MREIRISSVKVLISEGQKPLTSEDAKEEEEGRPHHSVISLVIHQSETRFRTIPTLDWGTREMFPRKGITMSVKLETIVLSIWPTNMCGWNSWPRPGLKCKVQACQATAHWQKGRWQLERGGGAGVHTCASYLQNGQHTSEGVNFSCSYHSLQYKIVSLCFKILIKCITDLHFMWNLYTNNSICCELALQNMLTSEQFIIGKIMRQYWLVLGSTGSL